MRLSWARALPLVLALVLTAGWASPAFADGGPETRWSSLDSIRLRWKSLAADVKAIDSAICDETFERIKERGWFYDRYEDGFREGLRRTAQDTVSLTGHFAYGFGKGAVTEVWNTVQLVLHPIRTVKGVWHAVTHPIATVKNVGRSLVAWKDKYLWSIRHDPRQATEMTGELTGKVAAQIAISKGTAKALKIGKAKYTAWQMDRHSLVTRWRGTDYVDEMVSMGEEGVLRSKAEWVGYEGSWVDDTIVGQYRHSLDSASPYSSWVSVTREPSVASRFGRVFEFEVMKKDLHRAWWNKFNEAEELVKGGTRIYGPRPIEAAGAAAAGAR